MKSSDCVFLTNMLDPRRPGVFVAEKYMSSEDANERETRVRLADWLESKTVGTPVGSDFESTTALEEQGYIGVYFCPEQGDTRLPAQVFDPDELRQVDDVTLLLEVMEDLKKLQEDMSNDVR